MRVSGIRAVRAVPAVLLLLPFLLQPGLAVAAAGEPLEQVGAWNPGTPGLNASAVGLEGFAYLGSWGSETSCPGLGVRVLDVRDPTTPFQVSTAASYARTTAEQVVAQRWTSASFDGNLLVAGIQRCAGFSGEGGLAVWDVSDPANPRELSYVGTGRGSRGVHELALSRRGDRLYAYLAVANAEVYDGRGELRVVDITDPANPVDVAAWGARANAGLPIGFGAQCAPDCRGSIPQSFLHSIAVSPDGATAYLSYWDLGVVILDVSQPSAPRYLGRFAEPRVAEGNTHSVSVRPDGRLILVADETFAAPWGRLRLVDVSDPANPVQVGTFDTPRGRAGTAGGPEVWYSIHNPLVDDRDPTRAYLAWYSDGVRLVDTSDPSAPREVAGWNAPGAFVWSVFLSGDYVLVGDVELGLVILRR